MTRAILFSFSLTLFSLLSCTQTATKQNIISNDTADLGNDIVNSYVPTYFDYKNTRLAEDYTDTAFARFSSDTTEDRFTLYVPKGLVTASKTTVRITTKQGEIIYEHAFPTSDLINGYATEEIKSDIEMEKYVLDEAKTLLKGALFATNELPEESYLSQAKKEDFENYDVFIDLKTAGRVVFHYRLNEESNYYLAYSIKQKKVVKIIDCC